MIRLAPVFALLVLAACGADGPPETPQASPGVRVSGEVQAGVVVKP